MYDLRYLIQVDLNITDLCNKTCNFCPRTDPEIYPNNNENMSLEMIQKIVDNAIERNFKGIILLAGRGESSCHPQYQQVLDIIHNPKRTYKTQLTTNGYKIEKYWEYYYNNFDKMILNTYSNEEEYRERTSLYKNLATGKLIEHNFKPGELTVEEINALPPHKNSAETKSFTYIFNSRCGLHGQDKVTGKPCIHPIRSIFVNFNGQLQMCCNDWNYQVQYANVNSVDNIFDEYLTNVKLKKINWHLINGQRNKIASCAQCGVRTDKMAHINRMKEDSRLLKSLIDWEVIE